MFGDGGPSMCDPKGQTIPQKSSGRDAAKRLGDIRPGRPGESAPMPNMPCGSRAAAKGVAPPAVRDGFTAAAPSMVVLCTAMFAAEA